MGITYNSANVLNVTYNSATVTSVTYNSATVFNGGGSTVILASAFLETDVSQVPPPYDEGGYNYNSQAPKKEADLSIPLGDITNYNVVAFEFNNDDSINTYGEISGSATIGTIVVPIFNNLNQNGTISIDTSSLSGEYALRIHIEAKSWSSYRWYSTKAVLHMATIRGIASGSAPGSSSHIQIDSGESYVPGPYDSDGYNYGGIAPAKYEEQTIDIGDVTNKTTVTISWANWYDTYTTLGEQERILATNDYGRIYATYTDQYGTEQFIYDKAYIGVDLDSGSITIDVTNNTGHLNITFRVYAKSESNYEWYRSRAVLDANISLS